MSCNWLVDSCSYFRLAQSLHPLLKTEFCEERHSLGVIRELQDEYKKSSSLKNKFAWIEQPRYTDNRKKCFIISADHKAEINNTALFMRETARDMELGVSRIDIICLAHAYVLKIPIVTDDSDLADLSQEYDVKVYNSLGLLKIMFDCGHIDIDKVRAIASYWVYFKDTPKSYHRDFRRLFGEPIPS